MPLLAIMCEFCLEVLVIKNVGLWQQLKHFLISANENGMPKLQEALKELIEAKEKLKAFTDSINSLKTKWSSGELNKDSKLSQVRVMKCF